MKEQIEQITVCQGIYCKAILEVAHEIPWAGHMGRNRITYRILDFRILGQGSGPVM